MKSKKALAMAVWAAVASIGFVMTASAAEETLSTDVEPVVVEGQQDVLPGGMVATKGEVGLLGEKDVMDTPFSVTNLTSKTVETFGNPTQPLQSVLVNNPSVRMVGTTLHNDYSIRGIKQTGSSMYVNGIPGLMTQFWAPTFFVDSVQFISGPNSGITGVGATYETNSAGGTVNMVSKKATKAPITSYKQTFAGKGSHGEYLDIGRRFGKNDEWGIRLNTELLNGKTAIDGQNIKAQGVFANIDRAGENAKSNLLVGYRHIDNIGGARWFKLKNSSFGVPKAPDASKNYGFDGIEKESEGYIVALNHEQKINDNWKWFANAGINNNKLSKNIIGQASAFTIDNAAGDVSGAMMSTQTITHNRYAQMGVNGKVATGDVKHDINVAVEKSWHRIAGYKNNYLNSMGSATGNIYTGMSSIGFISPAIETGTTLHEQFWGASITDTLNYKKSQLLLGIHKHQGTVSTYSAKTGVRNNFAKSNAVTPTYGYVYRPDDNVSLYASHAEHFAKGTYISGTYDNGPGVTDPSKTKQNEIGVKYENKGFMTSLALFDIKQANEYSLANYYYSDGESRYKGIELNVNGRIARKWNAMAGMMILDAEQRKTAGGANDGKTVNGMADFNAVASLEYNPDDKFSVLGRMVYTGAAKIYNDQLEVPSSTVFDLGVTYKTKINTVPVKLNAMCYNLFDKDYWTAHTGNGLILSSPRTFFLSATFDI